ncbi:MAG: cytochrome c5 family protein [Legionellales bacterium]|nr:cytochrome c5 family protein [Legionellales bacterium]
MRYPYLIIIIGAVLNLPMVSIAADYYDRSQEAIHQRTQPLGKVQLLQPETPTPSTAPTVDTVQPADVVLSGEQVYQQYCALCHINGVAGAPMLTDQTEWQTRLAQGKSVLLQHVVNGYRAMPAKGTCTKCSEQALQAAIDYMLEQAGL